jgi:hypothetical protein
MTDNVAVPSQQKRILWRKIARQAIAQAPGPCADHPSWGHTRHLDARKHLRLALQQFGIGKPPSCNLTTWRRGLPVEVYNDM